MNASSHLRFLVTAIRRPGRVGAVLPSSRALAERMTEGLGLGAGDAVVEFGPGTGSITGRLGSGLPEGATYLGVELDAGFVQLLARRHPELRVVHGCASDLPRHLAEAGIATRSVRAIVSGLPFSQFGPRTQDRMVITLHRVLEPGAIFRTFQYVHAYALPLGRRFRRRVSARLGPCEVSPAVLANVPPAYVLTWRRSPAVEAVAPEAVARNGSGAAGPSRVTS